MLNVSASKISEGCALYSAKEGFFEKMFLWKSVSAISPLAWWNRYCGCKELNKITCRILRLPATSAAVERSFSCYSNVHAVKRNRLSNKRAAKVVSVPKKINLDCESYGRCKSQFLTQHHLVHAQAVAFIVLIKWLKSTVVTVIQIHTFK